jgi:very-short-patch-repair endonuclease
MDVATYAELRTHLTPGQIRADVAGGGLRRVRRGVFVSHPVTNHDVLVAVQREVPRAIASHLTAAHLLGCADEPDRPHVTVPHGHALDGGAGVAVHRSRRNIPVVVVNGLRVTDPVRTVLDLARTSRSPEEVVLADAAVHARLVTPEQLRRALPTVHRRHGAERARDAVRRCRAGAESPMETRLRLLLIAAGLPEPVLQHPVRTAIGLCRLDLSWPDHRIAVEYDGYDWHSGRAAFARDRQRWRALHTLGWDVHPVSAADVRHPNALLTALRVGLVRTANR